MRRSVTKRREAVDLEKKIAELCGKAQREKRDLTADERRQEEAWRSAATAAHFEANAMDAEEEVWRAEDAAAWEREHGGGSAELVFRNKKTGKEVRALRAGDRMPVDDTLPPELAQRAGEVSPGRYVVGMLTGDWSNAPLEQELRVLSSGDMAAGGAFLPSPVSARIIDLARARNVVTAAGALTLPFDTSEITLVKVTGDPTPAWRGEGQEINVSEPTFGELTLRAKSVGVLVKAPRELMEDAANAASVVENTMAQAVGGELDRVALFGTGSALEPLGLYDTDGIGTTDVGQLQSSPSSDGGKLSGAKFHSVYSRAVDTVRAANWEPNAAIHNPRELGTIDRALGGDGHPLLPLPSWVNLRHFNTTRIPQNLTWGASTAASAGFVGNWSQLVLGMRTNVGIERTTEGGDSFAKHEMWFKVVVRMDVGVLSPGAFVRVAGILAES